MQDLQHRIETNGDPLLPQKAHGLTLNSNCDANQKNGVKTGLNRILVVEDDPVLMAMYDCIMGEENLPVDQSVDGHDALEKLSANVYDLVITDIALPGLDGISLLKWLQRNRPETRVVVISGNGSADSILAAMRGGAKDYLVKPFTLVEFHEMINRWYQPQLPLNRPVFSSLIKLAMHDVREESANLEVMIQRLEEGAFGEMPAGISSELHSMQAKVEKLKGVSSYYSVLARNLLRGGTIPTERISLQDDIIVPVLEEIRDTLQQKKIKVSYSHKLEATDKGSVIGNKVMLRSVFRTLFSNAVRQCSPSGTISYGISSNDRRYKLHVANNGFNVPVCEQANIFTDPDGPRQENGSSCPDEDLCLGLPLAKDILRQHGGDIWYESVATGSKFVCTLPCGSARPSGAN
jgi:CheY-like chemotaxis protein